MSAATAPSKELDNLEWLVNTSRLQRPFSSAQMVGLVLVSLVCGLILDFSIETALHLFFGLPSNSLLANYLCDGTFLVVMTLAVLHHVSKRRTENIRRLIVVAQCNHHIRNALQNMTNISYLNGYSIAEIQESVSKIESVLEELMPTMVEVKNK